MSDKADVLLWLDLETTGVDEENDPIIEIGLALTDATPDFRVIAEFERVVRPALGGLDAVRRMSVEVLDMHLANGLVRALLLNEGSTVDDVETSISIFLNDNDLAGRRIPLAGSGVSHFDRRFVRRQLPLLDKRLSFWAYDVGAVRRTLRLFGLTSDPDAGIVKSHRALADVHEHIAEMRSYATLLGAKVPA